MTTKMDKVSLNKSAAGATGTPADTPVGSPGASSPPAAQQGDAEDTGMEDTPRDGDRDDNMDSEAVMTPG